LGDCNGCFFVFSGGACLRVSTFGDGDEIILYKLNKEKDCRLISSEEKGLIETTLDSLTGLKYIRLFPYEEKRTKTVQEILQAEISTDDILDKLGL